ncbi:hypothetical protein PtA15_14A456 [Puccinia triticina]|uniref:REJ domain-containing protein n=1 Tax=Puccinia triticina TaxID=208348 RepID=A0ABY7D9I1_9BASI|nr:uncharacterized protein PtA15_14A456 [Puccinia triticina]WAQ91572.1 hypothetical protein PtA15_14A456 [Puccinia triticina]
MEQVEALPFNTSADTSTELSSQTSSTTSPEYTIQPFVTMPEKDSASLEASPSPASLGPPPSSQPPSALSSQSPSTSQNFSGPAVQAEPYVPSPVTPPANHGASNSISAPVMLPPSSMQANATLSSQLSPSDNSTNSHADEPHNISVTVQAVPGQASKHSTEPAVPPPSRGAVIALGALTAFFVTLIIGLLLWRRRQSRRVKPSDSLSVMEKNEKGSSDPPSRSTSSSHKPLKHVPPKSQSKAGPGISNPFSRRGINRPSRPASLPLDSRINKAERIQKAHSQEMKPHARPSSWRSSIASVWENLGLPSRVLHDPNSHFWSDSASVNSDRSTRNLVSRPSAIAEEESMGPSPEPAPTSSDRQPTRPQSPAPSRKTVASANTNEQASSSSPTHHQSPSSFSSQPSKQPSSKNLITSSQDTQSASPSPDAADSHTTSSARSQKSPTDTTSVKSNPKPPKISLEKSQVVTQTNHPSPLDAGSLDSNDDLSSKSSITSSPVKNVKSKLSVIALENTQVTQTIPI